MLQERQIINTTLCTEVVRTIISLDNFDVRTQLGNHTATDAGKIIYTPPNGEPLLRKMLHDWEE